ncbi:MAG TPA: AbrB/MazE/SpoVT family DNA-binding domain-containing protein [Terriglobales bacterium]|jgi:antitoxin MazE|nr:AbrB/MazE/SpoVT family DNA-binding domain-containing protein [Terriglobales bacterium]
MSASQIVKWGNSLAVRIPKPVAEESGFNQGDKIVIKAVHGKIELQRKDTLPTLRQLVAQITPENRYAETPTGRERGKEAVQW